MKATANTLNVGDKVYYPEVGEIREYKVVKIEKDHAGIKVGTDWYYYADFSYAKHNAAISTVLKYKDERILYIRHEDALSKQKELQIAKLKHFQRAAEVSLKALNEFTLKYFTES